MTSTNDRTPNRSPDLEDHDTVVLFDIPTITCWHAHDGMGRPACRSDRVYRADPVTADPEDVPERLSFCTLCQKGHERGSGGHQLKNKLEKMDPEDVGLGGAP